MTGLEQKLAQLRARFAAQLPERLRALDQALAQLAQEGQRRAALETLHLVAHKLNGAGGTFGFTALSDQAAALEQRVKIALDDPERHGEAAQAELSILIESVRCCLLANAAEPAAELDTIRSGPSSDTGRLVFLLEDDGEISEDLTLHLTQCGYQVRNFTDPNDLLAALGETLPSAVVLDVVFPGDALGGTKVAAQIRRIGLTRLPLLCISSRTDFEARLSAVRSGASAYLFKPLTPGTVIDQLDRLIGGSTEAPIRVVVVDDDPEVADYCCAILDAASMETTQLNDPRRTLETIVEARPDLLLMDLYMPQCTGVELAAVICQQDALASIPIVFLSSERDVDVHLSALDVGGDDFITKPFNRDRLVSLITARARRARRLRMLMTRDGLTGLLNHGSLMERLDTEINRVSRGGGEISLAMIDVDYFKAVNDEHGHARGDQVLKVLGRMLSSRFRTTDIVGRYGGEEFVVVFPDTDAATAERILDEVRDGFSKIRHRAGTESFRTTFSAGISSFPAQASKSALLESADRALYEAKQGGRNQIRLAQLTQAA